MTDTPTPELHTIPADLLRRLPFDVLPLPRAGTQVTIQAVQTLAEAAFDPARPETALHAMLASSAIASQVQALDCMHQYFLAGDAAEQARHLRDAGAFTRGAADMLRQLRQVQRRTGTGAQEPAAAHPTAGRRPKTQAAPPCSDSSQVVPFRRPRGRT